MLRDVPVGSWEFCTSFCVGRSRGCEVSIATSEETRTVSKRHVGIVPLTEALASPARAGLNKKRWLIYDLDTMNGTAVNGVELPQGGNRELHHGDEVVLASAMRHRAVAGYASSTDASVESDADVESFAATNANAESFTTSNTGVDAFTTSQQDTPNSQQRKRSRRGGVIEDEAAAMDGDTGSAAKRAQEHEMEERERLMMCPVCLEYFHGSATLPCSHTFCGYCISNWFRNSLSCPECRDVVKTVPVRNRALDELVERLVGQTEAYKSHVRRRARMQRRSIGYEGVGSNNDEDDSEGATRGVGSLQLDNSNFPARNMRSNVFTRWSVEEKLAFSSYINSQFGDARVATCRKVGLTEATVDRANMTELLVASQNLLLDCGAFRLSPRNRSSATSPPTTSHWDCVVSRTSSLMCELVLEFGFVKGYDIVVCADVSSTISRALLWLPRATGCWVSCAHSTARFSVYINYCWCWTADSGEININLQKMKKGFIWASVFVGHGELDPMQQEATKQQMMLERFQEENPGFDFSNAEFNGSAPDPRTFMGGVKYT
ncbi:unnamed protein product [Phytophthora lilii]|uniref:E3 ubiquitin-protein ligase CHFR n=1 Tax=Phytophthora lilii TaxID=2077276 RepID=A0A9W6T8R4_9STRA|nr:unnamed protein product [Phytophthora lilii]